MIIFLTKSQLALFDAPVHVAASVRKDGTIVAPHVRIQKVALKKPVQDSLFGEHEAPAASQRLSKLDSFIGKHGGLKRLAETLDELTEGQQQQIIEAMAKLDGKTPAEIAARFDGLAAKEPAKGETLDLFAPPPADLEEQSVSDPQLSDLPELVEHITKNGKGETLRGVILHGSKDDALAIDPYTFKKNGGWFIREKHLVDSKLPTVAADQIAVKQETRAASGPASIDQMPVKEELAGSFGVPAGITKGERRAINAKVVELVTSGQTEFTDADRALMRQYSGNGGCGDSLNEFYTDTAVASAMWTVLGKLGFSGGTALEPSCATGVFMHTAPAGVKVAGVELDPTSAKVAEVLHGDRHEIINASLERFATQDGDRQFDVVIGNAPFGLRGSLIKDDKPTLKTADGYFLDTSLDKAKPGGIVAMIVPTGVMDAKSQRGMRERLLRKGEFLGAMRMPNTAFEHSHTEVTTDIVFFRKRPDDVAGALMTVKQDTLKDLGVWDDEYLSGAYFEGRGAASIFGTMEAGWRAKAGIGQDITVSGSMRGVPEEIAQWTPDEVTTATPDVPTILENLDEAGKKRALGAALKKPYDNAKPGDTKVVDGVTYILQGKPGRWHRIDEFMQDAAVADAQPIAASINALVEGAAPLMARPDIEAAVRAYVEKHGNPGKNPNLNLAASQDKLLYRLIGAVNPDGSLSDAVTGRAARRIEGSLDTAAVSLSLEHDSGTFSAAELADRLGKDPEEVEDTLFASPAYAYAGDGQWTTMDQYLTGSLWPKLDRVREELSRGDLREGLAEKYALQARQLEDTIDPKSLEDVEVMINSAFLPTDVIAAYFNERKNASDNDWVRKQPDMTVTYEGGLYTVSGGNQYGDAKLLDKYLNRTGVRKDEDLPTIERWNEDFKVWLLSSRYRDQVEELYNRKFRGFRQQEFSDATIEIPGMATEGLKQYQYPGLRWALAAGKGIVAADVGLGKAQPLDAKVLTQSGWKLMGDIAVGDHVISVDGKPTEVTGVFPQGEKEIFRVVFHDGSSTECCDEHLWLTQTHKDRNNARRNCADLGVAKVRTLAEIRDTMTYRGMKNHAVPMVMPVHFNEQELPLNPYFLGALLGDGAIARRTPLFTSADKDIVVAVGLGLPDGYMLSEADSKSKAGEYRLRRKDTRYGKNEIYAEIKALGLNCDSFGKFVPDIYKFNSVDIRLAVLRGLMDTDGFVDKAGVTVQFNSCSERLANDVQFLVQSLGGTATIKTKVPTYWHKGEQRTGAVSHIVHLRMPPEMNPFYCERKASRVRPKYKYIPVRYIVEIKKVGKKPAQCISVSHKSQLYVTDDFIVTHNTVRGLMMARMAKINGQAKRPTFVVPKSVLANWMAEAEKWFPGSRVLVIGETYTKDKEGNLKSKPDTAAERNRKYHEMTQNDYDFVFISQPAFNDLDLDPITKGQYVNDDFWVQRGDKLGNAGDKRLNKVREAYKQAVADREFQKRTDAIYFNDLGIDMLLVDEGHAFKNLYAARARFGESPKFLGGQGLSNRALDMNLKTRWVREQNGGNGIYMMTATPTKNSPLEIYSMLSHIAPEAFEQIGIRNSEEFLDRFCEFTTDKILSTSGSIEDALVTVGFKNLTELRDIMRRYIDRKTAADVGLVLPSRNDQMHMIDMTGQQKAVYEDLRAQMAELATKKDATGDAHIFSIMDKMAKAAMDLELLDPATYAGAKSPKYAEAAEHIAAGAKDGGQVVFAESVASHEKIAAELVAAGIPRDQIAIINAQVAESSAKRQNISDAFNAGKIKVVIGNKTMEEGINLQKSTTDIHHLDLPWEPASMQQRNGRGLRQGNLNEAVRIHTYITKGSFDGYRYQSMMAKKDWQDVLWHGGDRVDNMAREGKFDRSDLLIMMSADPEAERAKFEADKAAATERYNGEQRRAAASEFVRFQVMKRSYRDLQNKKTISADRLRAKLERAKTLLAQNKYFSAKGALDSEHPVVIHPDTGLALQQGVGLDVTENDGTKGKWVVTGVNPTSGDVSMRRYGEVGKSALAITVPSHKLSHGVAAFKFDEAEEAKHVTAKLEEAAAQNLNNLTSWDDIKAMPSSVLEENHDAIQKQIKEGAKSYKFSIPYGSVPMVDKQTGKIKMVESYEHTKMHDTHDYLLPTDAAKEKAIRAWMDARRTAKIGTEFVKRSRGAGSRSGAGDYMPRRRYEEAPYSSKNVNPFRSLLGTLSGAGHTYGTPSPLEKEAKTRLETEQVERIRRAKDVRSAIDAILPLAKISGNERDGVAKYPEKALAMLWARARHLGGLHQKMTDAMPHGHNTYAYGSSHPNATVHAALINMARRSGHADLADAIAHTGERHVKDLDDRATLAALSKPLGANSSHQYSERTLRHMLTVAERSGLADKTLNELRDHGFEGPFKTSSTYGYGHSSYTSGNSVTLRSKINELLAQQAERTREAA